MFDILEKRCLSNPPHTFPAWFLECWRHFARIPEYKNLDKCNFPIPDTAQPSQRLTMAMKTTVPTLAVCPWSLERRRIVMAGIQLSGLTSHRLYGSCVGHVWFVQKCVWNVHTIQKEPDSLCYNGYSQMSINFNLLTCFEKVKNKQKKTGLAALITDASLTSFIIISWKRRRRKNYIWHMTRGIWHVTCDMWHVRGGGPSFTMYAS